MTRIVASFSRGRLLPDLRWRTELPELKGQRSLKAQEVPISTSTPTWAEPGTKQTTCRRMPWSSGWTSIDVAKAIVLPLVSPESSSYLNLTEQAIEAARRFPDRLIPFCCIDPRTSYAGGRAGLRRMLKDYVDQGAKGFGEHKAGLPIDHSKMRALYEVCEDLRLPVLFHMDESAVPMCLGCPVWKTFSNRFRRCSLSGTVQAFGHRFRAS